jgi:hypothetical protein
VPTHSQNREAVQGSKILGATEAEAAAAAVALKALAEDSEVPNGQKCQAVLLARELQALPGQMQRREELLGRATALARSIS